MDILKIIADRYSSDRKSLEKSADEIENFASRININSKIKDVNLKIIDTFTKNIKLDYDSKYGGFTEAPKFPKVATLNSLITLTKLGVDLQYMVEYTLDMMSMGGMYDLVDGGFCRYSHR